MSEQLPQGATQIPIEDFLAAIGELYFQNRQYQRVIAQLQQQTAAAVEKTEQRNGTVGAKP